MQELKSLHIPLLGWEPEPPLRQLQVSVFLPLSCFVEVAEVRGWESSDEAVLTSDRTFSA